jgi:flagellar biosynthesis protein FlhA
LLGSNAVLAQRSELVLSIALLGILVVLLVPLPTFVLDLLLSLNFSLTILLLLITLSARQALDFSVFPSLLLLLTLLRLSLNVATTRLILLNGNAGNIVETFGKFVVGGSLIVGLVIFLILVVIQFVVITKGAGRVSEVSARFTLDALPGKQVAIDAELNAGSIDDTEAKRRREQVLREAEFYGAMDGASKFVRGDAIAGLVITGINLIGGVIIGLTRNQTFTQAIRTFSILTIGDGLVSQIPALIISIASGILVTKATTQSTLGQEIGSQVVNNPRPLFVGAAIIAGLALTPGLPKIPFLVLAGLLFFLARRLAPPRPTISTAAKAKEAAAPTRPPMEVQVDEFLQVDRAIVEIGARLIPLVDPQRGAGLLDRISGLRRDLARKSGLWVPPIRVRDNIQLEPEVYRILIGGREVARGMIRVDRWLAIDPGVARLTIEGEVTKDPAFGLPAKWIPETERQRAELAGFTVVDALSVLITHLGEIVRRHSHELLSREDLKVLVDKVRETSPTLVDELIPTTITMGGLHRIVCLLLEEHVPITNLTRILESIANHASAVKDPLDLTERIRSDLGRAICDRYRDDQGKIHAVVLDPRLEMELRRSIAEKTLVLDSARLEKLVMRLAEEWRKASAKGQDAALLVDGGLRRALRQALSRSLSDLAIIAYQEVPGDLLLTAEAIIKSEDIAAPKPEEPKTNTPGSSGNGVSLQAILGR